MIKKLLSAAAVLSISISAHADCQITRHTTNTNLAQIMQAHNGFTNKHYRELCEKLAKANAALSIDGSAVVLAGQSIGWATVGVKDLRLPIDSRDYTAHYTMVHSYASQDKANELLYSAVNTAAENLYTTNNIDKALAELNNKRNQLKFANIK